MRTISGSANGATKNGDESEQQNEEEEPTEEELAPDGGWGWMVALGMIFVFTTTFGPSTSFTILFGEFLESTGQAGTATTILNSIFNISFSLAGLVTSPLLKNFSIRTVGVFGAALFSIPNILALFVQHIAELAIIFFLQGIGCGLIFTICNTNFNAYFVKRRATVMSASQAVIGLGCIVYPICIEKMMEAYGFQGTVALTGALSLHCIVGMALMHPVEWHYKREKVVCSEKRALMKEDSKGSTRLSGEYFHLVDHWKRRSTIDVVTSPGNSNRWNSLRDLKEDELEDTLLLETIKASAMRVASVSDVQFGNIRSRANTHDSAKKMIAEALSSSSLANLRVPVGIDNLKNVEVLGRSKSVKRNVNPEKAEMAEEKIKNGKTITINEKAKEGKQMRWVMSDMVDMTLLRDRAFINSCLGMSFVFTSDFTFSSLLPLMMAKYGYSQRHAALAITVGATAELASKILLAIFTLVVDARPKTLFFFAMICMALAKIGFYYLEHTIMGLMVMVVIIGVVRSWLVVPQPLVVVENISVPKFAAAYGLFAIISGVISIVFGPVVGFIKDWTDSFDLCQLVLLGLNILFIVPWGIEFLSECTSKKNEKQLNGLRSV